MREFYRQQAVELLLSLAPPAVYDGGHGSAVQDGDHACQVARFRMVMEARCLYLCLQMDNQLLVLAIVTARDWIVLSLDVRISLVNCGIST